MARRFLGDSAPLRLSPLGAGLINETHLVEAGRQRFVLQRINSRVFADADRIAENLLCVQHWLASQSRPTLRLPKLICATTGEATLRDADGHAWRLLEYVDNSRVVKPLENLTQAAEVGRALGRFHAAMAGLTADRLALTLPELHDTPRYKSNLDRAVQAAERITASTTTVAATGTRNQTSTQASIDAHPECPSGGACVEASQRVHDAPNNCTVKRPLDHEVRFAQQQIQSRAAIIPLLQQASADGRLSTQITHGDPKLDNILFARDQDRALCLVDLDTIQPGLIHHDLADCLRSCCNRSPVATQTSNHRCPNSIRAHDPIWRASTETLPSIPVTTPSQIAEQRAIFDLNLCQALLEGYAEQAAALFDRDAVALLYPAIRLIPLELAIRFLTDYLQGDRYFRVTHPRQNLDKTLIQLDLVRDIEAKQALIEAMIQHSFSHMQR
jgi:Ser/Thr protein kinase RdoA (MazF antagonist)